MFYAVIGIATVLLTVLVWSGHWQYALFSIALFGVIAVPFAISARKLPAGRRIKTVLGAIAILAVFVVVVFFAAITLNWLFWRIFHI